MKEKRKLEDYLSPSITVTLFEANDCISTSSDMDFGETENWNENVPGGGWT